MSKYINADVLKGVIQGLMYHSEKSTITREALEGVIDNVMPSADVVEVVRCKDCVYGIENGELCGQKVYLCSAMTNPNEFYGDFYCESGERKDG